MVLGEVGPETVGEEVDFLAQLCVVGLLEVLPVNLACHLATPPQLRLLRLPERIPDFEPEIVLLGHILLIDSPAPIQKLKCKLVLNKSQIST